MFHNFLPAIETEIRIYVSCFFVKFPMFSVSLLSCSPNKLKIISVKKKNTNYRREYYVFKYIASDFSI